MAIILITGAAGFIGHHLARASLEAGDTVIGWDNRDPYYDPATKQARIDQLQADHPDRFHFRPVDIRDADAIRDGWTAAEARARRPIDAVAHLAARPGVRPSLEDPAGVMATNVMGTQHLLEETRARACRQFVFGSSSSVYGVNPRLPWSENDPGLKPISPYAASKVCGELLGHTYAHLHGIRFIALRFFTVYGPGQRPDLAIAKFTRMIRSGDAIPVYGDGATERDYTYIDDIVAGIRAALAYQETQYEIINLGNDRTVRLAAMIEALEHALGRQAVIDRQPDQPGDVPRTWADIAKARHLLAYAPETDLPTGLQAYIASLPASDDR
ncbi:MAG: SDR family NAD(P)-dependent oxidoreductase [Opitutales bacterium]